MSASDSSELQVTCPDCNATVVTTVNGSPVVCSTALCNRRFQVWAKRRKTDAIQFYREQPSTRRKRYQIHEDHPVVSYVYDAVQRYQPNGLLDLIDDLQTVEMLLTGVSTRMELPLVLMFPVAENRRTDRDLTVIDGIGRLDCLGKNQHMSVPCVFIREILGADDICMKCDVDRFKALRAEPVGQHPGSPPWRYTCWAGRAEFAFPILANEFPVALFITGQMFFDSPEGNADLARGIAELERRFPQLLDGVEVTAERIAKLGLTSAQVALLTGQEVTKKHEPIRITSNDLKRMMMAGNEKAGWAIRPADVEKWRLRIADVGGIVQKYVATVYRERRALAESSFIGELFSLFECLPSDTDDDDAAIWRNTAMLLRRIAEFQGFEHAAFLVPDTADPCRLRLAAWKTKGDSAAHDALPPFRIARRYYEQLDAAGFDWCDAGHEPLAGTRSLLEVLCGNFGPADSTACVGYLRLREDEVPDEKHWEPGGGWLQPTYALLVLWQRVRSPLGTSVNVISSQTVDFMRHLLFEISEGLRTWVSLVSLRRGESSRKQLVADSIHGLGSTIHIARAECDLIEALLCKPELIGPHIDVILKGIRGAFEAYRHQIELTRLFTVMDAKRVEYHIEFKESLTRLIEKCIGRLDDGARRRNVQIEYDPTDVREAPIQCDPGYLEIAFMALIDNAIKYSFDKRKVKIRLREIGAEFIVEIEDFGQGILPGDEKKIFEKFYRGRQLDPNRYVAGTGIGLTVANDVVAAHGGKITMECVRGNLPSGQTSSPRGGFKVTFTIHLPRRGRV